MRSLQRLRNLIIHLPRYAPVSHASAPSDEFVMENTRAVTTRDLTRMHPGLFVEN